MKNGYIGVSFTKKFSSASQLSVWKLLPTKSIINNVKSIRRQATWDKVKAVNPAEEKKESSRLIPLTSKSLCKDLWI